MNKFHPHTLLVIWLLIHAESKLNPSGTWTDAHNSMHDVVKWKLFTRYCPFYTLCILKIYCVGKNIDQMFWWTWTKILNLVIY